jgi:hypothetical protein
MMSQESTKAIANEHRNIQSGTLDAEGLPRDRRSRNANSRLDALYNELTPESGAKSSSHRSQRRGMDQVWDKLDF